MSIEEDPGVTDPGEAERRLRAAEAAGAGGAVLGRLFGDAAAAYRKRFWDTGDPQDLNRAVSHARHALDADADADAGVHADAGAGATDPLKRAARANDLAVVLTDRYDLTGDPDDLSAALLAAREAMNRSVEGTEEWAQYAATTALCLWDRYDATGALDDLDTALDLATGALAAVADGALAWARICSNVGMMRMDRYERLGEEDDLQASVRYAQDAVAGAHADDPELGGWHNNLGSALLTRFDAQFPERAVPQPGDRVVLGDIEAAIVAYRKAIDVSPWGVAGRATFLANLGNALAELAEMYRLGGRQERSEAALREAVGALAEAVDMTAATAPYLASRLNVLGEAQRAVAERTGEAEDIDAARTSLRRACGAGLTIAPEMTVAAADNWMRWAVRRSAWDEVHEADAYLLRAAETLHRAQALRRHSEAWLIASRGLAEEAAYALTGQGRATDAALRLERGRAVLLSEELGLVSTSLARLPEPLRHRYAEAVRRVESARRQAG